MSFGEKLYNLRKQNGLSQEALAEKLNTTRQAVSKWENNQGYPEAEKLLSLSSIFGVSTDYLLKNCEEPDRESSDGYYVSKEKAEAWLSYENKTTRNIGWGIMFLLMIRVPFILFPEESPLSLIIGMAFAVAGIGIILAACLNDKDYQYKALKRNVLIFDNRYITELKERYYLLKKKYIGMIIISIAAIIMGATGLAIDGSFPFFSSDIYYLAYTILASLSIFVLIYSISMMDVYELLVDNDKHVNSIFFKMKKFIFYSRR